MHNWKLIHHKRPQANRNQRASTKQQHHYESLQPNLGHYDCFIFQYPFLTLCCKQRFALLLLSFYDTVTCERPSNTANDTLKFMLFHTQKRYCSSPAKDAKQAEWPQGTKTSIMQGPDRRAKNRSSGREYNLGALQECRAFKRHPHTTHCQSKCCHSWTFSLRHQTRQRLEQRTLVLNCTQPWGVWKCRYRRVQNSLVVGKLCKAGTLGGNKKVELNMC